MSTKFGLLIDFDLLKAVTSTNTKPEVVLSHGLCYPDDFGVLIDTDLLTKVTSPNPVRK